jgi:uncharacterized YkwD family protein
MIKTTKKILSYTMLGMLLALPMANSADALSNTTTTSYNTYLQQYFSKYSKTPTTTTVKQPTTTTNTTTSSPAPAPTTSAPAPAPTTSAPAPAPTTTNTTTTAPTTNTTAPTGDFSAYQQEVLNIVNKERAAKGLSALKFNAELSKVATTKSQDMIDKAYFAHNSPTYGSPFDMMKKFGITYKTAGENIAMGQKTPQEVMTAWMNSEGHRKNILNSSFTEIGIGIAKDKNGRLYWTQMFIGR